MSIVTDTHGCARCHQDHQQLAFSEFTYPVQDLDGTTWTHWALCPVNGEPILLTSVPADSPTADAYLRVAVAPNK